MELPLAAARRQSWLDPHTPGRTAETFAMVRVCDVDEFARTLAVALAVKPGNSVLGHHDVHELARHGDHGPGRVLGDDPGDCLGARRCGQAGDASPTLRKVRPDDVLELTTGAAHMSAPIDSAAT